MSHIGRSISHFWDTMTTDVEYVLYLDIDGTLAEFKPNPQQSFIPEKTLYLLQCLLALGVPVILVTGRCLKEAQRLAQGLDVPIAASHGIDIYHKQQLKFPTIDPNKVKHLQQYVTKACRNIALRLEYKDYSVALHYREYPQSAQACEQIAKQTVQAFPDFHIKQGQCVWEIAPLQANKGYAIDYLQRVLNFEQHRAIFIGDDVTDEDGFNTVNRMHGVSIKVGSGLTQAHYRIDDIQACSDFLAQFTKKIINNRHGSTL